MGPIYEMEGESINIMEGDIVEIIFQRCVSSAVKSLAESRGIVATSVQPAGENYQTLSSEKLRELTDYEERERTRRPRHGQSERSAHQSGSARVNYHYSVFL